MSFAVAILGRPNVGKSTLFNRLVGTHAALVDDAPGLTRDRREGDAQLGDLEFCAIDTAGLEEAAAGSLTARMRAQTERALAAADVALLLIDAREGVTEADKHFAGWLRRSGKPIVLVANKSESRAAMAGIGEAYGLGLGDPVPISAAHGEGLAELYDRLVPFARAVPQNNPPVAADKPLSLAIVGRPNVGKSTLANRLLGEERLLTGPEAGITLRHRGRLDVARPSNTPCRYRRVAKATADRGSARAIVGCRHDARHSLCRNRHYRARRVAAPRKTGSDDCPVGCG